MSLFYPYGVVAMCCFGFAVVGGFTGAIVIELFTGWSKQPHQFAELLLIPFGAIAITMGYMFLFRMAYRVQLTSRSIRWRAPWRRGEVPLDRVRRIRQGDFTFQHRAHAVIEVEGGRKVSVRVNGGFPDFAAAIARQSPQPVEVQFFST